MKRKLVVCGVLVVICLSVLVVEGVSQPAPMSPSPSNGSFSSIPPSAPAPTLAVPAPPAAPSSGSKAAKPGPDFSSVQPQQEWTFEQLTEALKAVRARQKELKAQEADLLTKIAEKIEEKRKDLQKAEDIFQQLQNDPHRLKPVAEEKK